MNCWIIAAVSPGIATQKTPYYKSGALKAAIGFKTVACVLGAAWLKLALRSKKWA